MKRKRCPFCGSLNTEKRGQRRVPAVIARGPRIRKYRRYRCRDCAKWFSATKAAKGRKRYEPSVILKAAELYFDAEASYRGVARQLHIRHQQLFVWINELGSNCKSFQQVAAELNLDYCGYFLADGTAFHVKGEQQQLLLTADSASQDIPCAGSAEQGDYFSWEDVMTRLRDQVHYPAKGAVTDGDPALCKAIRNVFPGLPMQLCVRHLDAYHTYHFNYQFKGPTTGIERFLDITHRMLYATGPEHLSHLFEEYNRTREFLLASGLGREVRTLERKFPFIWTHFDHPGLPRTTNIIEGIIDQLKHKISDCHGFEYHQTACNSLQLLIMRYRFHRFSCSRISGHNGKSPLQLAGADTKGINWVKFSQKNAP